MFFPETSRKKPLNEDKKALIAIPAKMILFDDKKLVYLLFKPFAIVKISSVVRIANINETGVSKIYENEKGSRNTRIAPSPAPAEIPSNPGSARLFFRSD